MNKRLPAALLLALGISSSAFAAANDSTKGSHILPGVALGNLPHLFSALQPVHHITVTPKTNAGSLSLTTQQVTGLKASVRRFTSVEGDYFVEVGQGAALDNMATSSLFNLTPGAHFASFGIGLGGGARLAMSLVTTDDRLVAPDGSDVDARGTALAYSFRPYEDTKLSLTASLLSERNMLLGSVSSGRLGLAKSALTASMGAGTVVDLGRGLELGFDAAYAATGATRNPDSLITATTRLYSSSYSMSLSQRSFISQRDRLSLSINRPLRVFSGSANLLIPGSNDNLQVDRKKVSLVPSGTETGLDLTYRRPITEDLSSSLNFSYRNDADNVAGQRDAAAMLRFRLSF